MILFSVVTATPGVLQRAMQAVDDHQLSFWDSMLQETTVQTNLTRFFSEDMQYGRYWKGMSIENLVEL